jgi:hypothetical protein
MPPQNFTYPVQGYTLSGYTNIALPGLGIYWTGSTDSTSDSPIDYVRAENEGLYQCGSGPIYTQWNDYGPVDTQKSDIYSNGGIIPDCGSNPKCIQSHGDHLFYRYGYFSYGPETADGFELFPGGTCPW